MAESANIEHIEQPRMQAPLPGASRIEVPRTEARKLLNAAEQLPLYDNRDFYSTDLQELVYQRLRAFCPDEFDGLTSRIKSQLAEWPYWVLVRGLQFDEGNRLFVALNRAFGELVAPPYEKPRVQLVHYIQPSTDLKSVRGGRESERLHTDTADWRTPVELISMACVRPDRDRGGRSRILDVDTIRDEVRMRLGPAKLGLLENEPVPWQVAAYAGGGVDWRPVLSKSGVCWRRYTIDLAINAEGALLSSEMIAALDAFEDVISSTPRTADFLMLDGDWLISDNTKTIHSRTEIRSGDASNRLMLRAWIRTT